MPDLNEEIRKLKGERMSLRAIATALGISHVTVLKRLRAMEGNNQALTSKEGKRLPVITEEKDNEAIGSISHTPRLSEDSDQGGNQAVTSKTPSVSLNESVNPSGNPFLTLSEGAERGVSNSLNDLFGAVKGFLENHGVRLYRMQMGQEAYQVKHERQTIRFYVYREGPVE